MRALTTILGNSQRLDGGAMFGNAPKALWERLIPADEHNRIPLACRSLLIREASRNVLLEAGIGAFFDPKLKERYGVVENEHVLLNSLAAIGLSDRDIDVVVLSHLHFDHAGGLLSQYVAGENLRLLFPNAKFVVSRAAWERAEHPHPRDRASFIPELQKLLTESQRVILVDGKSCELLGDDYTFHYSEGHTPGLLLTEVKMPKGPIVFAGDLIPGTAWVHLPLTMGYDRFPEQVINEKTVLLEDLLKRNGRLFYTHDSKYALSALKSDDKGKFSACEMLEEFRDLRD